MLGRILLFAIATAIGSAFFSGAGATITVSLIPAEHVSKLVNDALSLGCKFNRHVEECVWTTPRMHFLLPNNSLPNVATMYDRDSNTLWLNITNLSVEDGGDYECQVTRTAARHKIVVTVHKPPDAVSIIGGTSIAAIKDVENSIICSVTNVKPEAKIEWIGLPSGTVVTTSQAVSGNPSLLFNTVSNLTIKPTDISRINYTCKVINSEFLGSGRPVATIALEASTSVDILHAPIISALQHVPSPAKPKYREHDSLTMTCVVSASNPSTVTWRWFSGGILLPGETTSSYVISDLPASLNGQQVICEAANSIGAMNFTYPFIVEYGPRLKKPLVDIEVDLGEQHSFLCDIDSNPIANLYWRKMDNQDVVKTDKTLQFTNIKGTDIGGYTCVASVDGFQEVVTANAYLLLKGPPKITGDEEHFASQGDDAEIACEAESIPKETTEFTWTKGRNAIPVDFAKKDKYQQTVVTGTHGKSSKLTIKGITTDDFVAYNCTVANARGSYSKAFRLQQRDDFPWQYAAIGGGSGIGLIVIIAVIVCLVKRRKSKSFRKNPESASMDSPTAENAASKPYYLSNYGAGYAAPGIWMPTQYGDPTNQETYPLNMDVGYENMGSGDNMPQHESFQPSPTRFEPFYSTFPRGQTHYAVTANDAVDNKPVPDQGFYSSYATGQRPMRHFSDPIYNPASATTRGTFDYQEGYLTGQQIHMDRPTAAETSHLATNV